MNELIEKAEKILTQEDFNAINELKKWKIKKEEENEI